LTTGTSTRRRLRMVAALLCTLPLALPAAADAQEPPVVETDTVSCAAQVDGYPTFSANIDVIYVLYEGDREYTVLDLDRAHGTVADDGDSSTRYELEGYVGGAEVAPEGPPNVVVHGSATMVRLRWSWWPWSWGWYKDGRTEVSCRATTYFGI
jgi:hypothetical protein